MENFVIPLKPFLVFLIVIARVGGLMTFAPFWSHKAATTKIRVVLAMALAVALTPAVMPRLETPPSDMISLFVILLGEIAIGCFLGFIGRIIFSGFELAAHFVGAQMGFSLAGTIDPSTQAQTAAFGTIAQMLGMMVLLAVDGHHWFLAATIRSFSTTAPGSFVMSGQLLSILIRISADALAVGVAMAAPAIIVLLVVEFSLEFFGRTAPQFQIFIIGFPIKIAVGLSIVGSSLYYTPSSMRGVLSGIYHNLIQALSII